MAPSQTLSVVDNRTGKSYTVPISGNTVEAQSFKQAGLSLFDAGLRNTAPVQSAVAHQDGQKGILYFRGNSIHDLFKNEVQYEDILYLLCYGELPTPAQKAKTRARLNTALSVPQPTMQNVISAFPPDSPPMPMILAGLEAHVGSHPEFLPSYIGQDIYSAMNGGPEQLEAILDEAIPRALAALARSLAITFVHRSKGKLTPLPTLPNLSFVANMFRLMGRPLSAKEEVSIERMWRIYADNGLSNATAAFYTVASTGADPVSAIIGALNSGYGPLHGGAMEMVFAMLFRLKDKSGVPALLEAVKQKKEKLWGFGHRVYEAEDPRARHVKAILDDYPTTPMMETAAEIERLASQDPFFSSRHIHMNADLWGCFLYIAMDLPYDYIYPLTTITRSIGYMARWREFLLNKPPIWRPQQKKVEEKKVNNAPSSKL